MFYIGRGFHPFPSTTHPILQWAYIYPGCTWSLPPLHVPFPGVHLISPPYSSVDLDPIFLLFFTSTDSHQLTLPSFFSIPMPPAYGAPSPIWGWASPSPLFFFQKLNHTMLIGAWSIWAPQHHSGRSVHARPDVIGLLGLSKRGFGFGHSACTPVSGVAQGPLQGIGTQLISSDFKPSPKLDSQ